MGLHVLRPQVLSNLHMMTAHKNSSWAPGHPSESLVTARYHQALSTLRGKLRIPNQGAGVKFASRSRCGCASRKRTPRSRPLQRNRTLVPSHEAIHALLKSIHDPFSQPATTPVWPRSRYFSCPRLPRLSAHPHYASTKPPLAVVVRNACRSAPTNPTRFPFPTVDNHGPSLRATLGVRRARVCCG
ncbi:hypothetical protein BC628DRAFT_861174 [Trametes gibbosa]|nr:hypothetical protein BC628DRAFT_861174 [Trametes gibbosa]